MPLYLACGETAGIETEHLAIKTLQTPLTLGDEPGDEAAISVARHRNVQRASVRVHRFLAFAIPGMPVLGPMAHMWSIPQLAGSLGF
jgi:hypothetical protein